MLLLVACTDYGFNNSDHHDPGGKGDTGPQALEDDDYPPEDTSPPEDTNPPGDTNPPEDTAPPTDTAPPQDGCYEPEDGYDTNPAARIFTTDSTTVVSITFYASDTDYDDDLYLDSPSMTWLGASHLTTPGTVTNVGPFAVDSELIFGLQVANTGDHWQSGPGSRNADGVIHVAVTYEGACSWLIGFEDLYGGGDLDYNDVVLRVQGMLRQEE